MATMSAAITFLSRSAMKVYNNLFNKNLWC